MNNIYKAFNVNNETEFNQLIESLDLDNEQHIELYTSLNESMSVDGIRYIVESLTKKFDNGSYEKIQEQYKKKNSRKKKETVYDHSWYETDDGDYPKRTKEGIICETEGDTVTSKIIVNINNIVYDIDDNDVDEDSMPPKSFNDVEIEVNVNRDDEKTMQDETSERFEEIIQSYIDDYITNETGYALLGYRYKVVDNGFNHNDEEPISSGEEFDECLNEGKEDKEVSTEEDDSSPRIIGREKKDPKSNADPTLAKEIAQIESVVNNTNNPQVLKGLLASVEAKLPLAIDVEQMNQLGELKQKLDTKINALSNTAITESVDYNNDKTVTKELIDIFKSMSYKENESNEARLERIFNATEDYFNNYKLNSCELIRTTYASVDNLLTDVHNFIDIEVMDWAAERFDAYFDGEPEDRDDMDTTEIYDYLRSHFSTQDLIYDIDYQTLSELLRKTESKLSTAYDKFNKQKTELSEKPKLSGEEFNESVNYDPLFDEGDNVSFTWGGKEYTGRIIAIHRTNIELYDIVSYNNEKNRLETFVKVDPFENKMERVQGDL